MSLGILVDVTRCEACERCVIACARAKGSDPAGAAADRVTSPDGLSSRRLVTVARVGEGRFARKSCMHCLEPTCVSACLVGAIRKTPEGPVVYDKSRCIGCRYCMLACPFHVPRYEWDATTPYVQKCDMCFEEVRGGGVPACVGACPYDALTFGPRDALLALAHRRINEQPDRYINHVWGEREFGGTSVLYVSDVDLSTLDWPDRPATAIPRLTEPLLSATPLIGIGVATCMIGINWVIRRRMRIARIEQSALPGDPGPSNDDD